jgi:hypothetical protein
MNAEEVLEVYESVKVPLFDVDDDLRLVYGLQASGSAKVCDPSTYSPGMAYLYVIMGEKSAYVGVSTTTERLGQHMRALKGAYERRPVKDADVHRIWLSAWFTDRQGLALKSQLYIGFIPVPALTRDELEKLETSTVMLLQSQGVTCLNLMGRSDTPHHSPGFSPTGFTI